VAVSSRATAADVWSYSTRTLTQSKFPFWSAIITQQEGYVTVLPSSYANVSIQPPSGETWWVEFATAVTGTAAVTMNYYDNDGTNLRLHLSTQYNYSYELGGGYTVSRILTNSLYAALRWYNGSSTNYVYGYYGYSGFKLSQPLWTPKRLTDSMAGKPWKKAKSKPLPDLISALDKYAYDILGIDPNRPNNYDLGIILEEDTPLAIDPATNFPVERLTVVVKADVLADFIAKFKSGKADPVATGYSKYLKRWKEEGVDFGIPGV
jgi:hypothetical protein